MDWEVRIYSQSLIIGLCKTNILFPMLLFAAIVMVQAQLQTWVHIIFSLEFKPSYICFKIRSIMYWTLLQYVQVLFVTMKNDASSHFWMFSLVQFTKWQNINSGVQWLQGTIKITIILQINKTKLNKTIPNCQRDLNVHLIWKKFQVMLMNGNLREKIFLPYATNWLVIRTFRCGHGRANLFPKA